MAPHTRTDISAAHHGLRVQLFGRGAMQALLLRSLSVNQKEPGASFRFAEQARDLRPPPPATASQAGRHESGLVWAPTQPSSQAGGCASLGSWSASPGTRAAQASSGCSAGKLKALHSRVAQAGEVRENRREASSRSGPLGGGGVLDPLTAYIPPNRVQPSPRDMRRCMTSI